jgi:hypothetical protein
MRGQQICYGKTDTDLQLDRLGNYQVQLLPNKDASPDHGQYHPWQRRRASTTNEVLHAK